MALAVEVEADVRVRFTLPPGSAQPEIDAALERLEREALAELPGITTATIHRSRVVNLLELADALMAARNSAAD